ncbi:MAG: helix-turn-helix transcriptional regulator [Spirochaetota bacterium]|nr:helix-turn-helix transcriptional regulator [Spirochaetota bacterium]
MSQAELGEKLGIAKQNISVMERGARGISKAMARDLAELFQISPGRFI